MKYAMSSFNDICVAVYDRAAPGKSVVFEQADVEQEIPIDCLTVRWLNFGSQKRNSNDYEAIISLNILVPYTEGGLAVALERATQIDTEFGFNTGAGFSEVGRFDYSGNLLNIMRATAYETSWQQINESGSPSVRLQRTIRLTYRF